ncbi:hypothetical protein IQ247_09080 [Plectonema cf. radiosum LEGE 06105]|uniref:Uncharacterized protein n=1 Tax=Plectonema cf. radiosum LEGE 06105 TaxID=945769 RepID=A0A8J7FB18_9CYAN|nr:hypothetical protein [Plectonema radiosum]MBE9212843.1 hypothetical protein [Plectonema cf. radiosum LEGE 06105]
MVQAPQQITEFTKEKVQQAVDAILEVLAEPEKELHKEARDAFVQGDYARVKRLASTNLSDYYCKSLGYLGGALKLTPNTDTILAESARAAADFNKEKVLSQLRDKIKSALG